MICRVDPVDPADPVILSILQRLKLFARNQ
jgi:hypothetical protein